MTMETGRNGNTVTQQSNFVSFIRKVLRWGSSDEPGISGTAAAPSSTVRPSTKQPINHNTTLDAKNKYDVKQSPQSLQSSMQSPSKPLSLTTSGANSIMSSRSFFSDHSDGADGKPEQQVLDSASSHEPGHQHNPAVAFSVYPSNISQFTTRSVLTNKSSGAADSASVFTIASSSKRQRRRSLDTNASTRALVAESIFSRTESIDTDN